MRAERATTQQRNLLAKKPAGFGALVPTKGNLGTVIVDAAPFGLGFGCPLKNDLPGFGILFQNYALESFDILRIHLPGAEVLS